MNFTELVNRRDRGLTILDGTLTPRTVKTRQGTRRAILLSGGARFRLTDAQTLTYLRTFPKDTGWHVLKAAFWGGATLEVAAIPAGGGAPRVLARTSRHGEEILLDWPSEAARSGAFHLEFHNPGSGGVLLDHGAKLRSRVRMASMVRGEGLEVGPGANPLIKPSDTVRVRYVERKPVDEWVKLYPEAVNKKGQDEVRSRFANYIQGDAARLDGIDDRSLDFIFSSHVFEHLSNPLGVIEHWARKLRPGGVIVGVVPDSRFCFDLRQPLSTIPEMLEERRRELWETSDEKFARWCRFSAPGRDPKALKDQGYAVHAHFYTPSNFRDMADLLIGEETLKTVFLDAVPNNKDFGFALWV